METAPAISSGRGGTSIDARALEKLAAHAAADVPGVLTEDAGLDRLTLRGTPRADMRVDDRGTVTVDVHVVVSWPSPVAAIASTVRTTVARRLVGGAGVRVARVNVEVDDVRARPAGGPRRIRRADLEAFDTDSPFLIPQVREPVVRGVPVPEDIEAIRPRTNHRPVPFITPTTPVPSRPRRIDTRTARAVRVTAPPPPAVRSPQVRSSATKGWRPTAPKRSTPAHPSVRGRSAAVWSPRVPQRKLGWSPRITPTPTPARPTAPGPRTLLTPSIPRRNLGWSPRIPLKATGWSPQIVPGRARARRAQQQEGGRR